MSLINILWIIVSLVLITLILLQQRSADSGGLFGSGGGGGGDGSFYQRRRGLERILFIATIVMGALFIILAILNFVL